jgi:hypothetical protein
LLGPFTAAVEGIVDEAAVRRLLRECNLECAAVHVTRGKSKLDRRIGAYNQAAKHANWVVLRDLDLDAECPPTLARSILPVSSEGMIFCIATRSLEAWLIADVVNLSRYFHISENLIPKDPNSLSNPKQTLSLITQRSRLRAIREDMTPIGRSRVGPGYTTRLIEFIMTEWRPSEAALRSDSLFRALRGLKKRVSS